MDVVLAMAGDAGHGRLRALLARPVAGRASHRRMASDQREAGTAVIEARIVPAHRRMTGGAVAAVGALVDIVLKVAGDALPRSAGEPSGNMASDALRFLVGADQREAGHAMIEGTNDVP